MVVCVPRNTAVEFEQRVKQLIYHTVDSLERNRWRIPSTWVTDPTDHTHHLRRIIQNWMWNWFIQTPERQNKHIKNHSDPCTIKVSNRQTNSNIFMHKKTRMFHSMTMTTERSLLFDMLTGLSRMKLRLLFFSSFVIERIHRSEKWSFSLLRCLSIE